MGSPEAGPDPFDDDTEELDDESLDAADSSPEDTSNVIEGDTPSSSSTTNMIVNQETRSGSASIPHHIINNNNNNNSNNNSSLSTTGSSTLPLSEDSLPRVVAALDASELSAQLTAAARLRRLLSADDPPIKEAVGRGAVPRLVELLRRDSSPRLQLESAWALTNIASGAPEHVRAVVDGGALTPLCRLLRASDSAVREQAAWALGNIAGDGAKMRDKVLVAGALNPLVRTLRDAGTAAMQPSKDHHHRQDQEGGGSNLGDTKEYENDSSSNEVNRNSSGSSSVNGGSGSLPLAALRTCVWALSNLVRGKPAPPLQKVASALPVLAELTRIDDEEVLTDVCWALSYLGERSEGVDAVIETGVCRRLAGLLAASSASVQKSALHAVGNIVAGSQVQAQAALDGGALPLLTVLLSSPDAEVQRLAAWAISNVTAGSSDQIQAVIDHQAIPPLLNLLRSPSRAVRKEAAFAIVNVTTSPWPQHTLRLVDQGVVEPLCELLSINEPTDIVTVTLEGLQNVLKVGETLNPSSSPTDASTSSKISSTSTLSILERVEMSGKDRMIDLCEHHKSGSIHNITITLLLNYFHEVGGENNDLSTETSSQHHSNLEEIEASNKSPSNDLPSKPNQLTSSKASSSGQNLPTTDKTQMTASSSSSNSGVGKTKGGKKGGNKNHSSGNANTNQIPSSSMALSGERVSIASQELTCSSSSSALNDDGEEKGLTLAEKVNLELHQQQGSRSSSDRDPNSSPTTSSSTSSSSSNNTNNGKRIEFVVNIKNFTARRHRGHPAGQYSEIFDGKKAGRWRLLSYTHGTVAGKDGEWLSLYVSSADVDELACKYRWSRTVDYSITLVHPSTRTGAWSSSKKNNSSKNQMNHHNQQQPENEANSGSLSVTRRHTSVVFRGVHNDYEWGCRDFLPSDQVAEQGFLMNDSLLVRVEVELRDDGPGQPLSVLTQPELRSHLAWAAENGLPRACLACLTTFACNNGAGPELGQGKATSSSSSSSNQSKSDAQSNHLMLTTQLSSSASALVSATCSEEWGTPLHLACIGWRPGNARVVTLLLDCGAPVDALNKHGETPLVLAAREGGQTSVVSTLLDRGGNPCLCSKGGWSPMSAAASRGRDDVVKLLSRRGAPLEEVWPPLSALLEAAKAGHSSTALTLLECGADPEVQDEKGNTSLWILLEKNMTDAALSMVQLYHASVAQCSRERSKVQRAKLLLKHAQRRSGKNNNNSGASGHMSGSSSSLSLTSSTSHSTSLLDIDQHQHQHSGSSSSGGGGSGGLRRDDMSSMISVDSSDDYLMEDGNDVLLSSSSTTTTLNEDQHHHLLSNGSNILSSNDHNDFHERGGGNDNHNNHNRLYLNSSDVAALDLVKELEEEENNKATKSSKNKKKKEKAKLKKQQLSAKELNKKTELENEKKLKDEKRKKEEDEKRNKLKKQNEEKERIRRDAAKLEWQQHTSKEPSATELLSSLSNFQDNDVGGDNQTKKTGNQQSNSLNSSTQSSDLNVSNSRKKNQKKVEGEQQQQQQPDPIRASSARSKKRRNTPGDSVEESSSPTARHVMSSSSTALSSSSSSSSILCFCFLNSLSPSSSKTLKC
mmetsp:Transcript_35057/g.41308  ORF Transcript_35057/g.41308 Transcript_35057/m.41308 type:complete len:1588 (+) Transcript_35057:124-4887(+)